MAIKCLLSTIMGAKRLKMTEVADGAGLARSTVFGLYHDKVKKVDYAVLDKLCSFLNCQPGDLLVYVPEEKDSHKD
ncbi:helix-turn-helix domain-containing protein [Neomoorella thermoacetica]|uniref:Transcriptional regulator, Cro/CI family n=2 Tax=Neomoorella thermoacetica TaxID=1525 RepID=Q2RHI8_MOOTA|nr:helix-turn-helix transcriptional regulator [Moorella thermoacetica]AKX94606.1 hypothetical protein MOTHE_c18170 [Moorella thermoacetica]AKX97242.1 hypothetical protein MOTHA_c19000 [Moorella thermoacetica]OIQ57339.1 hypothetical protein MOCA_09250 [Moorella thermoacetica]QDA01072.1 hypothetical protein MothHH_01939 [Moorella thermoacetica]TYL10229.1 hypothetical protein MOOCA_08320 [Moorella thermoacetica]